MGMHLAEDINVSAKRWTKERLQSML